MEMVKVEIEAVQNKVVEVNEEMVKQLAELQLALIGGGTTDVTFC